MAQEKQQSSVLGLAPLPRQQESSSLVFYDPFAGIYHRLAPNEKRIVNAWRQQALDVRAKGLQIVLALRAAGEIVEEASEEFAQTCMAVDSFTDMAKGTESEAYVEEFAHRQKQLLARHEEDLVIIGFDITKSTTSQPLSAVLAEPEKRRNFFERLAYLLTGD